MTDRVVVIGGNFAGLTAALSLKQELDRDVEVTVVSKDDRFLFMPSLIWVPFGKRNVRDIVFPSSRRSIRPAWDSCTQKPPRSMSRVGRWRPQPVSRDTTTS